MTPKEFSNMEGKIRRTVYAIVFQDLVTKVTIIDDKDIKNIIKGVKLAMEDAVENAIEYMEEYGIIEVKKRSKSRKKK